MGSKRNTKEVVAAIESLTPATGKNTGNDGARPERMPLLAALTLWVGGRPAKVARGVKCRRSFPITAYVGANGSGKSLMMVNDTIDTLDGVAWECDNPGHEHTQAGVTSGLRHVLSTVRLLDDRTGDDHPLYVPFTDFSQLLHAEHVDILMDEVVGIASSRESGRMDPRIQNVLVQLRRRDVVVRWTAPNWARADKIIREVTQAVVLCRGYFAGKPKGDGSATGSLWAPNRVFRVACYDTFEFDEWSSGKEEKISPVLRHWFKGVGSRAFRAYDTLDSVSMVATPSPTDECETCGGRIRRPACRCGVAAGGRGSVPAEQREHVARV